MTRRKTHEEFVKEVYELVGSEYTVLGRYKNKGTKISIWHEYCGYEYEVSPNNFLSGRRCPKCNVNIRKTHGEFVKEVYELVGSEYTVLGRYKNKGTKISIRHEYCGHEYEVSPNNFLSGRRCPKCNGNINVRKTHGEFVKEVYELVGEEYIILGEYEKRQVKLLIRHEVCGHEYKVKPHSFLDGKRCPKCRGNMKKTTEQFKKDVYELVGDEYNILGNYENVRTKLLIRHEVCGHEYMVKPDSFLRGNRCPKCKESKGESKIRLVIESLDLCFMREYVVSIGNSNLRVDFVIIDNNDKIKLGIEYDGEQHYKVVDFFGGEDAFKEVQKRDKLKNQWFKENNIPLLRIPYWDYDNIEAILNKKLIELGLIKDKI